MFVYTRVVKELVTHDECEPTIVGSEPCVLIVKVHIHIYYIKLKSRLSIHLQVTFITLSYLHVSISDLVYGIMLYEVCVYWGEPERAPH